MKIALALALALALAATTTSAFAAPQELNRCQTDNTFAYWTPDACAKNDTHNGVFAMRDTTRNFTEHVKRAECMWKASVSDSKLYKPPPGAKIWNSPPHPECDYPAAK